MKPTFISSEIRPHVNYIDFVLRPVKTSLLGFPETVGDVATSEWGVTESRHTVELSKDSGSWNVSGMMLLLLLKAVSIRQMEIPDSGAVTASVTGRFFFHRSF